MTVPPTTTRRTVLRAGAAAPVAYAASGLLAAAPARADSRDDGVTELERSYGTTVGLVAVDLTTGRRVAHRAGRRFPMLSVFKSLAAAAVLRDRDRRGELLDRRVFYPRADVLEYAPETALHVADGMTVRELLAAALQLSDNTAANLLLREIGGPRGLTTFLRSTGDDVTRLDRWEPHLNTALPGDERDTTTPQAIARTYAGLLVGRTLSRPDRRVLTEVMLANTTSDDLFRRGLPPGWTLADKTGSGDYGTSNDVGVAWRPDGTPVVIAALTRRDDPDAEARRPLLADIARLVADRLG